MQEGMKSIISSKTSVLKIVNRFISNTLITEILGNEASNISGRRSSFKYKI
jgi:hypothetical protein